MTKAPLAPHAQVVRARVRRLAPGAEPRERDVSLPHDGWPSVEMKVDAAVEVKQPVTAPRSPRTRGRTCPLC